MSSQMKSVYCEKSKGVRTTSHARRITHETAQILMPLDIEQPPTPSILLASLRNTGYTLKSAIADVIDNSITAQAQHISVQFRGNYGNNQSWIAICDDGEGMDEAKLRASMKFGSRDLSAARVGQHDLGRFGLGMKTASISQCRKVTVFSWKEDVCHAFYWDLDEISSGWNLKGYNATEISEHSILKTILGALDFNLRPHGTIVLWEKLDRDSTSEDGNMAEAMSEVKEHIAEVFHRFMQKELDFPSTIHFDMNRGEIAPSPPFGPANHPNRYVLHGDSFNCEGHIVKYQPYILPRAICYESNADYLRNGGVEGYQQNQGFYVYRNRRLIEKATWFRKRKKEYKTQLLRIQLDIPAELDELWGIDVRKSQTMPPNDLRRRIDSIVTAAMNEARSLWDSGQRNIHVASGHLEPAWSIQARGDNGAQYTYKINTNHEMYKTIAQALPDAARAIFSEYITLLGERFPYERYQSDIIQNSGSRVAPDIDAERRLACLINNLEESGLTEEQVRGILSRGESFYSPELIEEYLRIKYQH